MPSCELALTCGGRSTLKAGKIAIKAGAVVVDRLPMVDCPRCSAGVERAGKRARMVQGMCRHLHQGASKDGDDA